MQKSNKCGTLVSSFVGTKTHYGAHSTFLFESSSLLNTFEVTSFLYYITHCFVNPENTFVSAKQFQAETKTGNKTKDVMKQKLILNYDRVGSFLKERDIKFAFKTINTLESTLKVRSNKAI